MDNVGIERLGLSVRSKNALKRAGIFAIEDLVKLSKDDLCKIKNIGTKSVNEILDVIFNLRSKKLDCSFVLNEELDGDISIPICDEDYLVAYAHNTKGLTPEDISYVNEGLIIDDIHVDEMNLSVRSNRVLKANNCFYLSKICALKMKDVTSFKSLGKKSIDEIIEKVKTFSEPIATEYKIIAPNCVEYLLKKFSNGNFSADLSKIKGNIIRVLSSDKINENYDTEPEKFEKELVDFLMNDNYFISLFSSYTYSKIKEIGRATIRDFSELFTGEFVNYISDILQILIDTNKIECVDGKYEVVYQTFKEYLETLDDSIRGNQFLKLKASGETLENIGDKNGGLTRERVRQLIIRSLMKMPVVKEDKYLWLFEKYYLDKNMVISILGLNSYSYEYFCMKVKKAGSANYLGMLDEDVAIFIKKNVEKYRYRNYIDVGDEKVEKTRNGILQYVLKTKCKNGATYQEIEQFFNDILIEFNLDNDDFKYPKRYFETKLANQKDVLCKHGKKLRYYIITEEAFSDLLEKINFYSLNDIEISTKYFINNYQEVMNAYDIRDEYELHNLLKKHQEKIRRDDVIFNRMPNIGFGKFDRDMQVLNLLIENAPIRADELSLLFEYKYGMKDANAIYFGCINEYLDNGVYKIDYEELLNDEKEILTEILQCDIMSLSAVRQRLVEILPNADLEKINNYNLRKLGYKISVNLVFSTKYGSFEQLIKNTILSQEIIDLVDEDLLLKNQVFYNLLWESKSSYQIVEFYNKKFIHIKKLESLGISKDNLLDFSQSAKNFANGRYFTVQSLKNHGFEHELFQFGFDDYFYESVLRYSPLLKFFPVGIGSTPVFNESENSNIRNMLESIIMNNGSMDIYDMLSYLNNEYGINTEKYKLAEWARESNLYYSDTMEKIYKDYDEFFEEI